MVDILIVDDLDIEDIKNCIEQKGSILKDRCSYSTTQFATKIPESKIKSHSKSMTAIDIIQQSANIDLAFLDFQFEEEEKNQKRGTSVILISKLLREKHPHCQIIIMSNVQLRDEPLYNYEIGSELYISIPKWKQKMHLELYNEVYTKIIRERFVFLMNECSDRQKNIILAHIHKNGPSDSTLQIGDKGMSFKSLFFQYYVYEKFDKEKALIDYFDYVIDVPVYNKKSWNNEKKGYRKYGMKEYFYDYYKYYSWKDKYSMDFIIEETFVAIQKLIYEIIVEGTCKSIKGTYFDQLDYRMCQKFELEKINGKIHNADMKKFISMIRHRLLCLGMYFGLNLSCTGINYLLQDYSYEFSLGNIYKHFKTFLNISLKDQISTETDNKIKNFTEGDRFRASEKKDQKRNAFLEVLDEFSRNYDGLYKDLANYEKKFVKRICLYTSTLNPIGELKNHINYILEMVDRADNLK